MTPFPVIKFLDPYEKGDQDIYFGREDEIEQLHSKVKKTTLLVLYGLSGTGKTSILRCGLANKFDEADWHEIFIRRGSDRTIMEAILKDVQKTEPGLEETDATPGKLVRLLERISRIHYKHIYLIFDQFEELFINGSKEEKGLFIEFIKLLIDIPEKFATIIIVLREEFLANLNDFRLSIKTIFNDGIRLERMSVPKLKGVIARILSKADLLFDDSIVDTIIDNVVSPGSGNIDLPYVQVYLKKLFDNIQALNISALPGTKIQLTAEMLPSPASIEDLLGSFLDSEIDKIANDPGNHYDREDVWKMLKILITPDGIKRSLTVESIINEYI